MDKQPLVSILIPNYNKVPYLRETLDSVLAQTYTLWECIIVDDQSTDNSWEILEEYANRDSRFKIFIRPDHLPKGGNVCRNLAFDISMGDLILYLDSDDILADFCLNQRINALSNFPEKDFWAFPTALFQKNVSDAKYYWNVDDPNESDLSRFLRMDVLWQTSGPIYSREFVQKLGGFNPKTRFWQDYEVHLKALITSKNYGKHFDLYPDVFIREGDKGSLSRSTPFSSNLNILKDRINFLEEMYFFAIKKGVQLTQEELYSIFSFQYYLVLQIWIRHGRYGEFKSKWLELSGRYKLTFYKKMRSLLIGMLLKLNNRFSIDRIVRTIQLNGIPDYYILDKVQIGHTPIKAN
ncbi:MAG: glycosyltransferase family 2 protein [Bacteroidota bacterium]